MKQQTLIITLACIFLFSACTPTTITPTGTTTSTTGTTTTTTATTIIVKGKHIVTACGDTIILKGVNYAAYGWGWNNSENLFSEIAKSVGAYLLCDIAHIAGLVATGYHPSPFPYSDFVTTTTHKTLRGPRGGMIFCKQEYSSLIQKTVFPGLQGGPLPHVIAAKAVSFYEALQPSFKVYQQQINCTSVLF